MVASGTGDDRRDDALPRQAPAPPAEHAGVTPASPAHDDDIFLVRPRKRASPLRMIGLVIVSILVTSVLVRAAVEAIRAFLEP